MHSVVTVLKSRDHDIKDRYTLLYKLRLECTNNHAMYLRNFDGGLDDFYHEMELYIRYRVYDTGFCDLIPDIMANVTKAPIIVIDNTGSDYNVYVSIPFMQNSLIGTIQSHSHTGSPIVLYRTGYHYDACLGTKPLDDSSFKHKVNEYPFDRHNNVVDRHDNASDCHDNVVDSNDNVYCHDDASVFHSNVSYSCRNMFGCHDNVFNCHDNVVDCHGDVSQDSYPCLVEICNEECQLGINSSDFKETNSNPNGFASIHRFKGNHP